MIDFTTNDAASEQGSYSVALWTDTVDLIDLYEYFCFGHMEALQLAISEHKMAGRPFPAGTRFLVEGPCHDQGCGCGKKRAKAGFLFTEAASEGWTN